MITTAQIADTPSEHPTVWGLTPEQLHVRFWAARGVQIVRQGERPELVEDAELFLLVDPRTTTIFRLRQLMDTLTWLKPDLMQVRITDSRAHPYKEHAVSDTAGRFIRFERDYGVSDARLTRVAITTHRHIAEKWIAASDSRTAWRRLRRNIPHTRRTAVTISGRVYDNTNDREMMQFIRDLVRAWKRPDATIERASQHAAGVWTDNDTRVHPGTRFVGNAWIGAGRDTSETDNIVGPTVLWDHPDHRPNIDQVRWREIEPTDVFANARTTPLRSSFHRIAKRLFDIAFSLVVLAFTLPFYPLIMLAIWIEDGRPFFFAHQRESVGGAPFPCLKFRSMRKDADQIKQEIMEENQVDGPQFFIEDDPRLTRVGRFIRAAQIDEWPQFINVLLGDMSVVGPRPSPHAENQYCPPWRETRLSVRPGVTGLWQVMRTREEGLDFQEWIRYDIEYVERASFWLDMRIIWKTILHIIRWR